MNIAARSLGFTYGESERPAFADLELSATAGDLCAITGPNGAGKTSALRVLSGLAPAVFDGEVTGSGSVDGQTIPLGPLSSSGFGVMTDSSWSQLSGLKDTVEGEIVLGLENRRWSRSAMLDRQEELISRFDLRHLRDRSPLTLSGGETQRMLLAIAVAHRPKVLLLDEPELHLDPKAVTSLQEKLREEAEEGACVLTATSLSGGHPLGADHVVEMNGRESTAVDVTFPAPAPHHPGADLLAVEGLTYRYGHDAPVVNDVSFTVRRGEVVGLMGPNGAGKTTTARLILNFLKAESGSVSLLGRITGGVDPSTLAWDAGLVFSEPADQLFHRTVEAEVQFGGQLRGWPEADIQAAADRALRATGLDVIRNENPRDLPHSHRRLLCLSCMLAAAPSVLILDEPTAGMDSGERGLVTRVLQAWASAGGGVLAITHDTFWARNTCTRVLRMEDGRLLGQGPNI